MQFRCKVIGHELVTKDDEQWLKVKLKGTYDAAKVEVLVPVSDRAQYPLGSPAVLDFSVRQTDIDLEPFNEGPRRRGKGVRASKAENPDELEQVEMG